MNIKSFMKDGFMLTLDLDKEYYSVHLYKGTEILENKFFDNGADATKYFEDTQRKVLVEGNKWD